MNKITMGRPARNSGFAMDGYWVWDPSVIRGEDGRYHMFASRWPNWLPMHPGWLLGSEVVRAVADSPAGPFEFQEVVLPARGVSYWDGRATHNPRVLKHGDTYLLFHIGMTHPFPEPEPGETFDHTDMRCIVSHASKRIGLATSKSVLGPWTRSDAPILPTKPGTLYSAITSNPAPCLHDDGSVSMIFKARAWEGNVIGPMTLAFATAPHFSGPYTVISKEPVFSPTRFGEVEDPFLWRSNEGFELIAKDMWGTLCGEHHGGVHARSQDGETWRLADPPLFYSRQMEWSDGSAQKLGSFERAFLLIEDGRPTYLFGATADGPGGFTRATTTWNLGIPLQSNT